MAPQNPGEPDAPDRQTPADGLSERELERQRRRQKRLEARRQREELRRIEREMRGPMSAGTKLAIAAVVVLAIAVLIGGWLVYCSYSVNLQRNSFAAAYERADLARLRRYAPEELEHVEQLREKAENRSGWLGWQHVIAAYREAEEALAQAAAAAAAHADAYTAALARFRVLKEEAVKNRLDEYAKGLWTQVLAAEAAAVEEPPRGLPVSQATDRLVQTNALLQRASTGYPRLREFDALYTELRRALASATDKEWERNAPEAWAAVQERLRAIRAAQDAMDWAQAAEHCAQARALVTPALETLSGLKTKAAEAARSMEEALRTAEEAGMPRASPEAWARIDAAARAAREASAAADYAGALRAAQQAAALLQEAGQNARQAAASLETSLAQVRTLYEKAAADGAFFAQNAGAAWADVQEKYRQIPALLEARRTLELASLCAGLRQQLEALLQERDKLSADLRRAESRLEAAAKMPLFAHLERNLPESLEKVMELRRTAQRRRDRGELRAATDLLLQCADETERLLKELDSLRSEVLLLRTSLMNRSQRYQEGMRRFRAADAAAVSREMTRMEQLLAANQYVEAAAVARQVDARLPKARFESAVPGTVTDYERGLMWVADPATFEGGNQGKPLDWYEALRWADAVSFAGFEDWRLPTEDELADLARLQAPERAMLLPESARGAHWTKVPAKDVAKALAVDLATGTIFPEDKRKPLRVRTVRQPD